MRPPFLSAVYRRPSPVFSSLLSPKPCHMAGGTAKRPLFITFCRENPLHQGRGSVGTFVRWGPGKIFAGKKTLFIRLRLTQTFSYVKMQMLWTGAPVLQPRMEGF
ncbi:MAG: hypothetical protein C6W57_09635 [Caldibacillus debilis]|nr:MAG: hypothetical protein C6W57_09635 [Caldibacillus debilis]